MTSLSSEREKYLSKRRQEVYKRSYEDLDVISPLEELDELKEEYRIEKECERVDEDYISHRLEVQEGIEYDDVITLKSKLEPKKIKKVIDVELNGEVLKMSEEEKTIEDIVIYCLLNHKNKGVLSVEIVIRDW